MINSNTSKNITLFYYISSIAINYFFVFLNSIFEVYVNSNSRK